jgi:hypothetical protein
MIYSKVQKDNNNQLNNRQRRSSQPQIQQREQSDREKIALDITILKKQYDKLKERQKQAHIILTSAVTKQNQQQKNNQPQPQQQKLQQTQQQGSANVNKLLIGKHAIISKTGRKGPPKGKRKHSGMI